MTVKKRLDVLMVEKGLEQSRERAKALIMSGIVYVGGQKAESPGQSYPEDSEIEVRGKKLPFVSRGGLKLQKAIEYFGIDPKDKVVMDIGASTGGFTDCLLQHGAKKVYAVDVGYGQLAWSIRTDPRVVCMERCNIRYVTPEQIGEPLDMAVTDVSFISLKLVLPVAKSLMHGNGEAVALIKPQFECGKELAKKFKGVVLDKKLHKNLLEKFCLYLKGLGFKISGLCYSSIQGKEGNLEYLFYLNGMANFEGNVSKVVDEAFEKLKKIKENRHFF